MQYSAYMLDSASVTDIVDESSQYAFSGSKHKTWPVRLVTGVADTDSKWKQIFFLAFFFFAFPL